jgi:hypothetical protein
VQIPEATATSALSKESFLELEYAVFSLLAACTEGVCWPIAADGSNSRDLSVPLFPQTTLSIST